MTGDEYRRCLARLDMTQVEAARFLCVDPTTTRRWLKDDRVPIVVAMLLRVMIKYDLSTDRVETVARKKVRA